MMCESPTAACTRGVPSTMRLLHHCYICCLLYIFIKMLHFVKALARPRVAETVERQTFDKDKQPFSHLKTAHLFSLRISNAKAT